MSSQNLPPKPRAIRGLEPLPDEALLDARRRRFTLSRRITALVLGIAMGLTYMLVAETINQVHLPKIPIYQIPPGLPWTALIGALAIGLLALLTAWSDSSAFAIVWGSLAAALIFDVIAVYYSIPEGVNPTILASLLVLIILPVSAMAAVVIALFRWAINYQQSLWQDHAARFFVIAIPILMVLIAAGVGTLNRYPATGEKVVARMNTLVQAGLAAPDSSGLPQALTADQVGDFKANAVPPYTLQWSKDPNNRYAIPRPLNSQGQESIVIARFANGWKLICLHPGPDIDPECVHR